jgi:glycosyltransferase involved in cell wall biosynthesis
MEKHLISFIIPYFNAGETIQDTIDSIFNQSYSNFDIWLINDGSTEQFSIDKLKDFEGNEKINILHQKNIGPSTARNKAIVLSKADFFVFLDSDDLINKETLKYSIEYIGENDVLFGDCEYFENKIGIKKQFLPTRENILFYNPIAICTITKAVTIKKILFEEELNKIGLEDWELWIHLFSKKYNFIYLQKVLFKIRVTSNSRTFMVANSNVETAKKIIFKKHSDFLYEEYKSVYYEKKEIVSNIDFRIGKLLFYPYRILKRLIKIK